MEAASLKVSLKRHGPRTSRLYQEKSNTEETKSYSHTRQRDILIRIHIKILIYLNNGKMGDNYTFLHSTGLW